jgi:uncharacterized protein involved in exopolysaccharide biosynthesis
MSDVVGPLWRRRWMIAAIVVVSTVGTYLVSSQRADRYRAAASVLVQNTTVQGMLNQPLLTTPDRVVADQALLVESRPVAERVIARLGLEDSAGALLDDVTAAAVPNSNLVRVSAERSSAAGAAQVANAFVEEHVALTQSRLESEIDAAVSNVRRALRGLPAGAVQRARLRDDLGRLLAAKSVLPAQARQVDVATPGARVDPHPARDALFAAVISTLLAIALAYALEWYSPRSWPARETAATAPGAGERDRAAGGADPDHAPPIADEADHSAPIAEEADAGVPGGRPA